MGLVAIAAIGVAAYGTTAAQRFLAGVRPLAKPSTPVHIGDALPLSVPDGFSIAVFADRVPGTRVLTRDPYGVLVVSQTSEGRIVALPDEDGNQIADGVESILEGLDLPHGIVFKCVHPEECALYVAEQHAVKRYRYDPAARSAQFEAIVVELPERGMHFTRTLLLHPDGIHLLTSVGSSCNACAEEDERRAAILATNLETAETRVFARGLRNTVFMTIHPVTGEVWGTDMGRDLLGDDLPPDEVNIIRKERDYGWPECFGAMVPDETVSSLPGTCEGTEPSIIDIPAHSAPLGLAFIPEEGWPEEYWHNLLVAYHGSWNRSVPTGYKIVRFSLDARGNPLPPQDFVTGFLAGGTLLGRPADILAEPGGTLFISDDRSGVIYRLYRTEPKNVSGNPTDQQTLMH